MGPVRIALPLLTVGLLCLAPAPASAQGDVYQPPDFITEPPILPKGWESRGVWQLGIEEAVQLAVKNNLRVVLQREVVLQGELGIDAAAGGFEPELRLFYSHSDVDALPTTSQEGEPGQVLTFIDDRWAAEVSKRFQTGTLVSAGWNTGRARSSLGTALQPLNYRSSLVLGVQQPLLRGFSVDLVVPRIELLRARLSSEAAREELAVQMIAVIEGTEAAYWDLVQALKSYRVQLLSQERAEAQLELTERQIRAGVLASSDLINSESTLAQRRLALVEAEATIERAWDRLRAQLNLPRSAWRRAILPRDAPDFSPRVLSAEAEFERALERRPEIRAEELEVRRSALALRQANNDKLPQLDLGLSYETVGQGGALRGALDQLAAIEAPGWTVFLTLSWTPLNRRARAAAAISESQNRLALARRDQRALDIYGAVREAVRGLDTAARQVRAASRFRELAEKGLELEERKFLAGTSSNFLVAERQESVARAQLAELTALLAHQKATVVLERETGRLLEARGIALEVQ
jgi:outer membrane protein